MATDIAKLMILVEAKGGKEAKDELDKVTKATNDNKKATKENTEATKTFSDRIKDFGSNLNNVAAGYYLFQQVLSKGAQVWNDITTAYTDQEVALSKLDAVLKSTGGTVGYTVGELSKLSTELSRTNAISRATVLNTIAVGTTFTQIGKEQLPEVVEQVFNLSRAFGNDFKSTMIQVGKAINDPIIGVGALNEVGVTFNQTQREQIKNFISANDLMSAQKVILNELEREVGGVAEAYGKLDAGVLDRLSNSLTEYKGLLGEDLLKTLRPALLVLTDFFERASDTEIMFDNMRQYKEYMDDLGDIYKYTNEQLLENSHLLTSMPYDVAEGGIIGYNRTLTDLTEKLEEARENEEKWSGGIFEKFATEKVAELEGKINVVREYIKTLESLKLLNKPESVTPSATPSASDLIKAEQLEAYLLKLQREYDLKNALMAQTGEDAELQRQLLQLEVEKSNLIEDSMTKYGIAQERMEQIFGGYFEKRKAQLEEEYRLQKQLQELNDAKSIKDEFLTIRESLETYTDLQKLQKTHLETLKKIDEMRDKAKNAIGGEGSTPESDALNMSIVKYMTPALKKQAVDFYNEQYQAIKKVTEASGDLYNLQEQLKEQALSTTVSITTEAFRQMGEALGGFNDEGESFSITIARMVADMTSAISTMFVTAGLQMIIKGTPESIALGVSLLALGGVSGVYSGYLGNKVDEALSAPKEEASKTLPTDLTQDTTLPAGGSRSLGSTPPQVTIVNTTGQSSKVETIRNPNGGYDIKAIIGDITSSTAMAVKAGSGLANRGTPVSTGH